MSDPSVHGVCGQDVRWVRKSVGSDAPMLPPLEFVGYGLTIDAGIAYRVPLYEVHECKPEQIERWRTEKTERATALTLWQRERAEQAAAALKRDCPRCDAQAGDACRNLGKRAVDQGAAKTYPHDARILAAGIEQLA